MDSGKFREMAEELGKLPAPDELDESVCTREQWREYCIRLAEIATREADYLDMIAASSRTMWQGPIEARVSRRITDPVELAKERAELEQTWYLAGLVVRVLERKRGAVWAVACDWAESDAETCEGLLEQIRTEGSFSVSEPDRTINA